MLSVVVVIDFIISHSGIKHVLYLLVCYGISTSIGLDSAKLALACDQELACLYETISHDRKVFIFWIVIFPSLCCRSWILILKSLIQQSFTILLIPQSHTGIVIKLLKNLIHTGYQTSLHALILQSTPNCTRLLLLHLYSYQICIQLIILHFRLLHSILLLSYVYRTILLHSVMPYLLLHDRIIEVDLIDYSFVCNMILLEHHSLGVTRVVG